MTPTPTPVNRILECLKRQKDCYVQLLAVAHRQKKAIDEQNDEDLLKAMQDKNPILQTLQSLDEEMQPAMKALSEADRERVIENGRTIKDQAARALEELIAVEDACALILQNKKGETFEQMKIFQQHQKGLEGYRQTGGPPSSRFSREG